jgi:hypothetical protein
MRSAHLVTAGAILLGSLAWMMGPSLRRANQEQLVSDRPFGRHDTENRLASICTSVCRWSRCHAQSSKPAQFASIPLQPVPPDRYEITFTDMPVNTRVSFRINDQNACDENPTGAVTRNVFANDVRLVQNTTTPGNGDEPGYALTVTANRTISQ